MKILHEYKIVLLLFFWLMPFLLSANFVKHEKGKDISKSFIVDSNSDVYFQHRRGFLTVKYIDDNQARVEAKIIVKGEDANDVQTVLDAIEISVCLLYTSPSPRDLTTSRMPSSA